jgi:hypothetical protein
MSLEHIYATVVMISAISAVWLGISPGLTGWPFVVSMFPEEKVSPIRPETGFRRNCAARDRLLNRFARQFTCAKRGPTSIEISFVDAR